MHLKISSERTSPNYWPLQEKGNRDYSTLTAVVRGRGPGAAAAAVVLAKEGFKVIVAGKRPARPLTQGRPNLVALRPEAMRQLDVLKALDYLEANNLATKNDDFRIVNEWTGMDLRPPRLDFRADDYKSPQDRKDHFTTHFLALGDMEDALMQAAHDLGVVSIDEATIKTEAVPGTKRRRATFVANDGTQNIDLGFCDVIVGAGGKGDTDFVKELGAQRYIGVKIDRKNLPAANAREMRFGSEHALESLQFCVLGFANTSIPNGTFHMTIRKANLGVGTPDQPINEYVFGHKDQTSMLFQLPRGMAHENPVVLENYIMGRINNALNARHASMKEFLVKYPTTWGNPLRPFTVETGSLLKYAYGGNTIALGDFAMYDSPSPGIGAEIATTVDSISVRELACALQARAKSKLAGEPSGKRRAQAFTDYNTSRAEASELWSSASRPHYLTSHKAEAIAQATRKGLVDRVSCVRVRI